VEFAQAGDVRRVLQAGMEAVIGLRQALVAIDHQFCAEGVISLAGGFQRSVGFETLREGEGAEAVGGRVPQIVLHRGREEPRPDFVDAGLEDGEGSEVGQSNHCQRVCVDSLLDKNKSQVGRGSTIRRHDYG
jgi:hypothetical protein